MHQVLQAMGPDKAGQVIPLSLLRAGQAARVDVVLGGGDVVHRLRELGLRDGAEVRMLRPGCPCIIRLAGQKFCVRTDDLSCVLVRTAMAN